MFSVKGLLTIAVASVVYAQVNAPVPPGSMRIAVLTAFNETWSGGAEAIPIRFFDAML